MDASLTMMFRGTLSKFKQAKPYFDIMSGSILYCGDSMDSQLIKVFNNVVCDINLAAISEIMSFAIILGLDPNFLEQLFTKGFS